MSNMKKVFGITLMLTLIGAVLVPAEGSSGQIANNANAYEMNLDRCPYYPSPAFCRLWSRPERMGNIVPAIAAREIGPAVSS